MPISCHVGCGAHNHRTQTTSIIHVCRWSSAVQFANHTKYQYCFHVELLIAKFMQSTDNTELTLCWIPAGSNQLDQPEDMWDMSSTDWYCVLIELQGIGHFFHKYLHHEPGCGWHSGGVG